MISSLLTSINTHCSHVVGRKQGGWKPQDLKYYYYLCMSDNYTYMPMSQMIYHKQYGDGMIKLDTVDDSGVGRRQLNGTASKTILKWSEYH